MSLFRTPTPKYRGPGQAGEPARQFDLCGWLGSLARTPTPAYRSRPCQVRDGTPRAEAVLPPCPE